MSDNTNLTNKPKKLWNDALKMVRGENNNQLVEQFTAEMTLVAEGLCEDQNRLRGEVDRMLSTQDQRLQRLDTLVSSAEVSAQEQQRETDRIVTELRGRIADLERQAGRDAKDIQALKDALSQKEKKEQNAKKKERNLIRDVTILIVVAAVAVIAVSLVLKLI